MPISRLPWTEELAIIDETMKAISGIRDPEELVGTYWDGIGKLVTIGDYVSTSRRGESPPWYLVTRSSRFTEHFNPWTQRGQLPRLQGGLLGEIAFANAPVIIDDLPARLSKSDPGYFYLEGFQSLVALPQYDGGEGLNVTAMLMPKGKEMDRSMIPILHWQSGLFGRGTQNLVLRNQLSAALAELDRELQVVGEIQRSLLPREVPKIPGCELAADYVTSARAGGDYYDFFPLADGQWGLFIADVSGHGTPAAVLMAITHAIAHAQPGTHTPPGALLEYLNTQLSKSYTESGTFVTAFYGVFDPAARTLTYSSAGHNPPRLVSAGGRVTALAEAASLPLGVLDGQKYQQARIVLSKGDLVLLYTDGITEAMPKDRGQQPLRLFGVERLDAAISAREVGESSDKCLKRIREAVAAFSGEVSPADDQTLVLMKVH